MIELLEFAVDSFSNFLAVVIILGILGGILVTVIGAFAEWRPFHITSVTLHGVDSNRVNEAAERRT